MVQFKNKNIRGQREGTRSRAVIDRVHDRARASVAKYRAAREALLSLRGAGEWETVFKPMQDGDVRSYQDPDLLPSRKGRQGIWEDSQVYSGPSDAPIGEDKEFTLYNQERSRRDGTGETRRTLSWIWLNGRTPETDDAKDDVLRSEWAKSRARAARSREEVMLLKEEMSRVLKFLNWKARWWEKRASLREDVPPELAEGLNAFALSQAEIQQALSTHFRNLWSVALQDSASAPQNSPTCPQNSAPISQQSAPTTQGSAAAADDDLMKDGVEKSMDDADSVEDEDEEYSDESSDEDELDPEADYVDGDDSDMEV